MLYLVLSPVPELNYTYMAEIHMVLVARGGEGRHSYTKAQGARGKF